MTPESSIYASEYDYKPQGNYGPRLQSNVQVIYVLQGRMSCFIDSKPYPLAEGEAMLLMPLHVEQFHFSEDGPTRHGSLTVSEPALEEAWFKTRGRDIPRCVRCSERLLTLASWLIEERYHLELRQKLAETFFAEFFVLSGLVQSSRVALPEPLLRVERWLQSAYANPLKLEDLAQVAALSPAQLIRLFRQHHSITPMRYLLRIRLERAAEMLRDSGHRISEIAELCGFVATEHFSRSFKREFGLSPRAYRTRSWGRQPVS